MEITNAAWVSSSNAMRLPISEIEDGIREELEHMMAKALKTIQGFRDEVAKEKSSPTRAIEWAGQVIEAEFVWAAAKDTLNRVRYGDCDLGASVKQTMEDLEGQLVNNRWAANSTSPLANGVDAAKAAAASQALHAFKCWNEGRSYSGHFGKKVEA